MPAGFGTGASMSYIPPAAANPAPTLPATAATDAGLGNSSIAAMQAVFDQLIPKSTVTQEDIQRAMTPVQQRQQMGLPASMQRPIASFQAAPMNQQPVVGAGNARARGIGNAITGAMNTVGSFVNARAQQVQDQHAQSVSKFLQAQASADQAKSVMDQVGPNGTGYAQAKATYDQNQALQKQMLGDDKFRKVLEKGMNVSLTDPSKNKTPDHQSFMQGMLHFKKQQQQQQPPDTGAMLKRFGEQQPTQLAPNQIAQAQLQAKLAQQKQQMELYGKIAPALIRAESQQKAIRFATDEKFRLEQYRQGSENARAWAGILSRQNAERQKHQDAKDLAWLRMDLANRHADHVLGMARLNPDPNKLIVERNAYDMKAGQAELNQKKYIETLTNDRDTYQQSGQVDKDVLKAKNEAIFKAGEDLKSMKKDHEVGTEQFNEIIKGKVSLDGGSDTSGKSTAGTTDADVVGGSAESGGPADAVSGASNLQEIYQALYGLDENVDISTGSDNSE